MNTAKSVSNRLLDSVGPRDQARMLEQCNRIGHSFMSAPPSAAMRFIIPSDRYRLGLRWWLGVDVLDISEGPQHCTGCNSLMDATGDHLLCCPRINFGARHLAVQEAIASLLQHTSQPFAREVQIPECPDGQLRPADLLLRCWEGGFDCAVDLTVSHGW